MDNIKVFYNSVPEINYIARTTTRGNEFEMVNKYIEYLFSKYRLLKKKKVVIFVEPQIDTGYPDIVIVEYFDCKNDIWNESRTKLTNSDLKILFEIQTRKNISISDLCCLLGFSKDDIQKSIVKLHNCKLIHLSKTKKFIRNVPLNSYCRICKIISLEAKVDKWSEAIRQATNNIWFATESYVLLNKSNCNLEMIEKCKNQGVGIVLLNGKIKKVLESEYRDFPVSYSSIQFNEWIQRSNHLGGN